MQSILASSLAASLLVAAPPAPASPASPADDYLTARVLVDVCLPYAQRSRSFEKAIAAARELDFRRPVGDQAPLDEWASEVTLVSRDGVWRLRLEEGSVDDGDRQAYGMSCSLSSRRASANQLTWLGRRAFNDPRRWSLEGEDARTWRRLVSHPDEYRLEAQVTDQAGELPALVIRGFYF